MPEQLQSPTFFRCERTIDGRVVSYTPSYEMASPDELGSGQKRILIFNFEKGVKSVSIKLDLDREIKKGITYIKPEQLFLSFLKGDTRLLKPEGSPEFILVNETEEEAKSVRQIRLNYEVIRKINSLGKGLYNLCHYLGIPLAPQVTLEYIYDKLLNFKTGLAFYGTYLEDGKKKPLSEKILNYESDPESGLYVTVNKAILLKIVPLTQGMFYYGGSMLGSKVQDVYSFFKNNENLFETLENDVATNEKTLYSVVSEDLWASEEANTYLDVTPGKYTKEEELNIRHAARDAGVIAWKNTNIILLLSKIEKHRAIGEIKDAKAAEKEAKK